MFCYIGKRSIAKSKEIATTQEEESVEDDEKPIKKLKLVVYGDSDSDND